MREGGGKTALRAALWLLSEALCCFAFSSAIFCSIYSPDYGNNEPLSQPNVSERCAFFLFPFGALIWSGQPLTPRWFLTAPPLWTDPISGWWWCWDVFWWLNCCSHHRHWNRVCVLFFLIGDFHVNVNGPSTATLVVDIAVVRPTRKIICSPTPLQHHLRAGSGED